MPIRVNTNIASINARRNLDITNQRLQKSLERLSSGLRINRAADDAAGLAITSKMRAEVKSMAQAVRNANDGISLIQTAEGSLEEIYNILSRVRELAEESANGTLSQDERDLIDTEFQQLYQEIDRIANVTEFNGIKLLDGSISSNGISLQVGINNTSNDKITITINDMKASALGLGTGSTITTLSTQEMARSALDIVDSAIALVSTNRGKLGAQQNRLDSTISNLNITIENQQASISRIRDVDFAAETANFTQQQILLQTGTAILAQANALPQSALSLLR